MVEVDEQEVLDTIRKALNLEEGALTAESTVDDIEAWDSLGHLGILSSLDKLFDGQIAPITEMATADSVQKILDLLKKHSFI